MISSLIDRVVRLSDGRALGFAEFGDSSGMPLFFFHGAGSTRLTRHPDDSIVHELGIRLITVDRPGIGLSDRRRGRRLLDWPDDVRQLADALGIDRFAVLGWSAGGPHALACAYALPHRLHYAGVISGLAPLRGPCAISRRSILYWRLRHMVDAFPRSVGPCAAGLGNSPNNLFSPLGRSLPSMPGTRATSSRERADVRPINEQRSLDLIRSLQWERMNELAILVRPWGFRLDDITSRVRLWHGAGDRTVPVAMGQHLGYSIPHTELTIWPNEGHRAGFSHWREVVSSLTR